MPTAELETRTAELETSRRAVVSCLARAAEYRDDNTGHHIRRVGGFAGIIASELGFDADYVEVLELAAELHGLSVNKDFARGWFL